jgi:pimeloyl-ACP methyl ester carboxylesterase
MRRLRPLLAPLTLLLTAAVTLPCAADPKLVQYATVDGIQVHARYYASEGTPNTSVVFLHQPGRSGADWDYIASKLAEKGVASIAPDLRGHGESMQTTSGEELDRELFEVDDYFALTNDVSAAVDYLRKKVGNGPEVQLVGADVGGTAALLYAVDNSDVSTLTLLSPGLMYDGVDAVDQVDAYGRRPLLIVVSMEDSYSAKSADVLKKEARGVMHFQPYYGRGHGTKMINREPNLEPLLTSWLLGTFKTAEGITLAEKMELQAQDKGHGLTDIGDMAAEHRERAEQALKDEQRDEQEGGDAVEGSDDAPKRWD